MSKEAINAALDKKAENARELGLDYEPAQQEPMAWMQDTTAGLYVIDHYDEWHCIPLYTSPAQRPWVGLTDEEQTEIMSEAREFVSRGLLDLVEAKLKEKNT